MEIFLGQIHLSSKIGRGIGLDFGMHVLFMHLGITISVAK
jgi:hypothetical protein